MKSKTLLLLQKYFSGRETKTYTAFLIL